MRSLYGVNPVAPAGSNALTFEELQPGMEVVVHYEAAVKPWAQKATVVAVYRSYWSVSLCYENGVSSRVYASDMGLVPDHHGWLKNYTTRA